MNKDKHVLPHTEDTFVSEIKKSAKKVRRNKATKTIYGPDNEALTNVNIESGSEFLKNQKHK